MTSMTLSSELDAEGQPEALDSLSVPVTLLFFFPIATLLAI